MPKITHEIQDGKGKVVRTETIDAPNEYDPSVYDAIAAYHTATNTMLAATTKVPVEVRNWVMALNTLLAELVDGMDGDT